MFVCSKPRARLTHKNYDRLLTHTHARTQLEDGFFLFFVFLLLHPLTAAAAAAGHHPGSSSFASQPEHSGRGRPARIVHGQRSPDIFCSSLSLSTPWKSKWSHWKIRTRPTRICSSSCLLLWLSFFFFAHTLTRSVHTDRRGKKKKVLHTRTHTHTLFFVQLCSVREENSTFSTPRGKSQFSESPQSRGGSLRRGDTRESPPEYGRRIEPQNREFEPNFRRTTDGRRGDVRVRALQLLSAAAAAVCDGDGTLYEAVLPANNDDRHTLSSRARPFPVVKFRLALRATLILNC